METEPPETPLVAITYSYWPALKFVPRIPEAGAINLHLRMSWYLYVNIGALHLNDQKKVTGLDRCCRPR